MPISIMAKVHGHAQGRRFCPVPISQHACRSDGIIMSNDSKMLYCLAVEGVSVFLLYDSNACGLYMSLLQFAQSRPNYLGSSGNLQQHP